MGSTIEWARFGDFCVNAYCVCGTTYLVCGRRGVEGERFTRIIFRHCRRPSEGILRTLQRQLQALEEAADFQEWFRRTHNRSWDPDDFRCPLCFLNCRDVASELRHLMGRDYEGFLAAALEMEVRDLPAESGGPAWGLADLGSADSGPHRTSANWP